MSRFRLTLSGRSRGWEPGRWYRVRKPDGSLWMETSDRHEAATEAEKTGWPLERLYVNTRSEWRKEPTP